MDFSHKLTRDAMTAFRNDSSSEFKAYFFDSFGEFNEFNDILCMTVIPHY